MEEIDSEKRECEECLFYFPTNGIHSDYCEAIDKFIDIDRSDTNLCPLYKKRQEHIKKVRKEVLDEFKDQ